MTVSEERKERLRAATERTAQESPGAGEVLGTTPEAGPRPGDLLILPLGHRRGEASGVPGDGPPQEPHLPEDAGIEWAVLTTGPSSTLLVPADTRLLVGPGDLEVAPSGGLGPLVLRCRHALTLPTGALAAATVAGGLPAATVERARGLVHRLQAGDAVSGREAERTAADPEYRAWLDDAVLPARRAAARLASGGGSETTSPLPFPAPRHRRAAPGGLGWALAALFLLAAVGLGIWNVALRSELGSPRLAAHPGFEIILTGPVRSGPTVEAGVVPDSEEAWTVPLVLPDEMIGRRIQVEVLRGGDAHRTNPLRVEGPSVYLALPASFLRPGGELLLRVWAVDGDEPETLAETTVILE